MSANVCPHCHEPLESDATDVQNDCSCCMRPYAVCPVCRAAIRLYDYWRRPGILPPLPEDLAGRKITFTVEEHPGRGELATFEEAGHRLVLWHEGRRVEWLSCPRA